MKLKKLLQFVGHKIKKKSPKPQIGLSNQQTREKWLAKTLEKLQKGLRILDAGAGELQYKKLCSHLKYVSQDFGKYDGQGNGAGLQTDSWNNRDLDIVSDITDIPEPDESFDAIMCVEVLEHLPNPVAALIEFTRLLKAGGHLIVTAPFCSLTHFAPYHFSTGFSRYFYDKHLSDLGFQIRDIQTNGNYFEYLAQEIRRIPQIAKSYSSFELDKNQQKLIVDLLRVLEKPASLDTGSDELLCFGYHVLAKKK